MIFFNSEQIAVWVASWLWPFIRILAMLTVAPVFDNRAVPRRVRIGLAAALAILVGPLLPPPPPIHHADALLVLVQQLLVGIILGFMLKLVFSAVEMAGDLLGLQMGLAFAQFIDPQRNAPSPLIGSFLGVLALLTFLVIQGHLFLINALVSTFDMIPISTELNFFSANKIAMAGQMLFLVGLQIALPVIAALLTANIAMGILSRAAPQMNITAVGFAITLLVGFMVLWMGIPYLAGIFERTLSQALDIPFLHRPLVR